MTVAPSPVNRPRRLSQFADLSRQLNRYISIRFILLGLILLVMVLPLGGIYFLHFYENELVRQTQAELISQAAVTASVYKQQLFDAAQREHIPMESLGREIPVPEFWQDALHPVPAIMDLSKEPVLSLRPDGVKPDVPVLPVALQVGESLTPVLQEAQQTTLSGIKILDDHGVQVTGQKEQGLSFAQVEEVQRALLGYPVSVLRQRGLKHFNPELNSISRGASVNLFVAYPILNGNRILGVIYASRTPLDLMKSLYNKRGQIIFGGSLLLALAISLALLTSRTITKPIDQLIEQARRIQHGDQSALEPIPRPMTREIAILSEQLAEMAQALQARSDYIKHFAMNVSHEFKTPLTAIQGSVELLQDHLGTMTQAERQRFLANIEADTQRLKHLVTRLLELARAETFQPQEETADVEKILACLANRYGEKGLKVLCNFPEATPLRPVAIASESLETILGNLLDNSKNHQARHVEVQVTMTPLLLTLCLQDDGEGVAPGNEIRLFEMFFTTRREHGGTGLGLSIIQALLQAHQGSIRYIPTDKGTCFEVTLPLVGDV